MIVCSVCGREIPGRAAEVEITWTPLHLPKTLPGGAAQALLTTHNQPTPLDTTVPIYSNGSYTGINDGIMTPCTQALSPHDACVCEPDKSCTIPFLPALIGYPQSLEPMLPHDLPDSECRGCSPLLQSNTQSARLPQFANSI